MTATLDTAKTRSAKPPRRVQTSAETSVIVAADIDAVWNVVHDVTRVGEWSHECTGAEWLGSALAPAPGARFRGRSRAGLFRWGRVCEIVSAEPYELVYFTVRTARYPDSTEWSFTLEAVDGGTKITQRFRALSIPKVLSVVFALLIPGHRDRNDALAADLRRLGEVAAASSRD